MLENKGFNDKIKDGIEKCFDHFSIPNHNFCIGETMTKKYYTLPLSFVPITNPRQDILTGKKFHRLTVLGFAGKRYWYCQCDCGNITRVAGYYLKDGQSKSCGCYSKERRKVVPLTHGKTKTKTYRSWYHIKTRCYNQKCPSYKHYGGRGITMCERWRNSFENFLADMGEPPTKNHSIDRIDVNGNYEPSNCRWATSVEQNNNRRNNKHFTYKGKTQTYAEWCREVGITPQRLNELIHKQGKSVREALGFK